uniref:Alternative protein HOXD3 n=1 Tax=Homo sapiens TaxID=9606 RepID=L8E8D1_HUMAN|nr:alternative protein HOXD3 [Homo sapiens]
MKTQDCLEAMATAKLRTLTATAPPTSPTHPLLLPAPWTLTIQVLPAPSRALPL